QDRHACWSAGRGWSQTGQAAVKGAVDMENLRERVRRKRQQERNRKFVQVGCIRPGGHSVVNKLKAQRGVLLLSFPGHVGGRNVTNKPKESLTRGRRVEHFRIRDGLGRTRFAPSKALLRGNSFRPEGAQESSPGRCPGEETPNPQG